MNRQICVVVAAGALFAAQVQAQVRPEVPESLKTPAGEQVVLAAHATGGQIYVCPAGAEQKVCWALKAPGADLSDSAREGIIYPSARPTWKHVGRNGMKGKVEAE